MKKKVLLVVPRMNLGGAESHVDQVTRSLLKKGWEVEVASGGGVLAEGLIASGVKHHWLPIKINFHLAVWLLKKILKKGDFSLVHAHSNAAGPVVANACEEFGLPWIYTAHTGIRQPRIEEFGKASYILAVSEYVKEIILRKGENFLNPQQVITFHNAIDCSHFKDDGNRGLLRKKWEISEDTYTIGIVARLLKPDRKGHLALLEVLARPEAKEWRLVIIGKAAWWYGGTRTVEKLAKKLGVTDQVIWTGHQVDVRPYIDACDVIALPSISEGCPLALQEAMAMSRPVVAYDGTGSVEVVGDNEGGLLVPNQNVNALAEALSIYENRESRAKDGIIARKRIERVFDLPQYIERLIEVYESVCK